MQILPWFCHNNPKKISSHSAHIKPCYFIAKIVNQLLKCLPKAYLINSLINVVESKATKMSFVWKNQKIDATYSQIQWNAIIIVIIIESTMILRITNHFFYSRSSHDYKMINRKNTRSSIKSINVSNSKNKLEQNENNIFVIKTH